MSTKVINLTNGNEYFYSCSPKEAVVCAYEQHEHNNWNTWQYNYGLAKLTKSNKHYYYGDYISQL